MGVASSALSGPRARELVFHRAAVDEFHPQADETVRPLDAVDDDDVAVADLGEERPFAEHAARERAGVLGRDGEELQRHIAAERVARAVDLRESSLADLFEHRQRSPRRGRLRGVDELLHLSLEGGLEPDRVGVAIDARERRQDAQLGEHGALVVAARHVLLAVPVDRPVLVDHRRQLEQRDVVLTVIANVNVHWPSPSPIARARGESPRAPHWPTAFQVPVPLPRGQANQRAVNRHARRVGRRLSKRLGHFLVAHAPFAPRDDRALVLGLQFLERRLVALDALAADRDLERRRSRTRARRCRAARAPGAR